MGYSTDFSGVLKIKNDLTASQLRELNRILNSDTEDLLKEFPEAFKGDNYQAKNAYIQVELTKELDGIRWDGSEKCYYMTEVINVIIECMKKTVPDFELEGSLLAQGEDIEDRWTLMIENNVAKKIDSPPPGKKIKCPHCGKKFFYEGDIDE